MEKLKPPYRNNTNQRYTKQLFYEKWIELPIEMRVVAPPFTLNNPKEGYVCFRTKYVNDGDPTGYTTAMGTLGDFTYWEFLMAVPWFREAKENWDRELDAKLKSEGMKKIRELAKGEDPKALQAARFLATQEYKKGSGASLKRGRPTKEEIEGNLKAETRAAKDIEDDAARIKLVI
jgi:hypothetical protein